MRAHRRDAELVVHPPQRGGAARRRSAGRRSGPSLSRWREVLGADHRPPRPVQRPGGAAAPRRPRPTPRPPPDATDPPGTGTDSGPIDGDRRERRDGVPVLASRFAGGVGVRAVRDGEHVAAAVVDHRERARRRGRPGARRTRSRRAPGPTTPSSGRGRRPRADPVGAGRSGLDGVAAAPGPARRRCPSARPSSACAAAPVSPTVIGRRPAAAARWSAGTLNVSRADQRPDRPLELAA